MLLIASRFMYHMSYAGSVAPDQHVHLPLIIQCNLILYIDACAHWSRAILTYKELTFLPLKVKEPEVS